MAKAKAPRKKTAKKKAVKKAVAPKKATVKKKAAPKKAAPVKKRKPRKPAANRIPDDFNPQLVLMKATNFGRPSKYDKKMCKQVYELYSIGYTVPMICRKLGISKKTYYNWCQDHDDFLHAHERGQMASQGWYEQVMRLASVGAVKGFRHHAANAIMCHHHGFKEPAPKADEPENRPLLVAFGDYIEPEKIKDVEVENVQTA